MPLKMRSDRKTYLSPELKKLTPDEARLLLVGGASVEDRGAKDISELLLCLLGPLKFCACGECRFDPRDTAIDVRVQGASQTLRTMNNDRSPYAI